MPSSTIYDSFIDDVFKQNINVATDTIKVMLVTGYTPNKGTHTRRSDVTAFEVTGTGYTAGGVTATITLAKDTTNHKETVTPSTVSWASSTISASGAVLYKSRGGASSADELIAYEDFGGTVSDTAGTFTDTFSVPLTVQN